MTDFSWSLLGKNISLQTISVVVVGVVSFGVSIFLGRLMGPQDFGLYNYALSIAAIFGVLIDGGYRTLLLKESAGHSPITQEQNGALISASLGHALLVTLLCLIGAVASWGQGGIVACALVLQLLKVVQAFVSAHLSGLGLFSKDAFLKVFSRTLSACAILVAWLIFERVEMVLLFWAGSIAVCLCLSQVRVFYRPPDFAFRPKWLKVGLAFVLIDAATAIYFRIDIILLEKLTGDGDVVGYYSAAFKLLEGIVFLFAPFSIILFREMRVHTQHLFSQLFWGGGVAVLCASAAVLGVYFFSSELIYFTFGQGYGALEDFVFFVFLSLFFVLPNSLLTMACIAKSLEWKYAFATVFCAILNVMMNFYLIPAYGPQGAAIATILTEAVLFVALIAILLGMNPGSTGGKRVDESKA